VAVLVPDVLGLGDRGGALEDVQGRACVTPGKGDKVRERVIGQGDATRRAERSGETALFVSERTTDDRRDLVVGQGFEAPDAHPRQERRVDLEVRILGGRPDERHGSVLDVGKQRVLLGLVEAVDLVEEQDRPRPVQVQPLLRLCDRAPDLDDTGHHGRHRREMRTHLGREKAGEAGLAGPGRTPQQQRGQVSPGDAPAQGTALADEVHLADELIEGPRPHPGREGLALGRRLEECLGSGADRTPGGWHVDDGIAEQRRGRCLEGAQPQEMRDQPQDQQEGHERPTDEGDPADVASHVRVFLGRRHLEARRPRDGFGSRRASLLVRRLGLALFGDDRGLELCRAGLFLVGEPGRPGDDCGWCSRGRRARRLSLQGWPLSRSGRVAAGALGHGVLTASIDRGFDRGRISRNRRFGLSTAEDSPPPYGSRKGTSAGARLTA